MYTARRLFNKLVPRILNFSKSQEKTTLHKIRIRKIVHPSAPTKVAQKNKLILSDGCAEFLRAGEFSAVVAVGCGGGESRGLQHSLLPQCWHKGGLLLITITGG